jgi:thymidylate kinase
MILCLEGPDLAGKSSTASRIADILERDGFRSVAPRGTHVFRCPGTSRLGELLRGPLKDKNFAMSEEVLSLAFAAVDLDAMQMAERYGNGEEAHVVLDRCGLSNLAYRRAFDQERGLHLLECLGGGIVKPRGARVVLLDLDEDVAQRRMVARGGGAGDRFEEEGMARWRRIREAYLSPLCMGHVDCVVRIQGDWDVDTVARMVLSAVA